MFSITLRNSPSIPTLLQSFIMNLCWVLSNDFLHQLISSYDFSFLVSCCDRWQCFFKNVNLPNIPRINLTPSECIVLFIVCWISGDNILLRIFIYVQKILVCNFPFLLNFFYYCYYVILLSQNNKLFILIFWKIVINWYYLLLKEEFTIHQYYFYSFNYHGVCGDVSSLISDISNICPFSIFFLAQLKACQLMYFNLRYFYLTILLFTDFIFGYTQSSGEPIKEILYFCYCFSQFTLAYCEGL